MFSYSLKDNERPYPICVVQIFHLPQDPNFFSDKHKYMESTKNSTTLRLLSYPSIPEGADVKPGQTRCGEHTDYGSITLLFQDEMPGLEVGRMTE